MSEKEQELLALCSRLTLATFIAAAPFALVAQDSAEQDTLVVVATTGMLADAARIVGGEYVEVQALMGPGLDPHSYTQTRQDIVALANADLVLWNGLYLEAQMEPFLLELSETKPVIAVSEQISEELLIAHDEYEGRFDPHIWMDPMIWSEAVSVIAQQLSEHSPEHAEIFESHAMLHRAELEGLDLLAQDRLGQIPDAQRVLLTAHDAFGYFGAAYDIEVVGVQGLSTESEAGLQRINALVDRLVEDKIGAVFVETSVSDRNMRALIEGAAAQGHEVKIGGELYSDAMGVEGSGAETYYGMMFHNFETIAEALGTGATQ